MSGPRPDDALIAAVAAARAHLGFADDVQAAAWPVWSPGGDNPRFVLVEIGHRGAIVGVAVVEAAGARVLGSVRLPGVGPHLGVSAAEAIERAGLPGGSARLVWAPSRQSMSPLYPLWEVRLGSELAYVDQQGNRWASLEPGGPGGAGPGGAGPGSGIRGRT